MVTREGGHVAAGKILKHNVVKRGAGKIDSRAVAKPADDVWMSHAIEGNRFVLEVGNQRVFEFPIWRLLQKHIERFDNNCFGSAFPSRVVARNINLRIAAAPQTFNNVEATVEPALLKLEFWHQFALNVSPSALRDWRGS